MKNILILHGADNNSSGNWFPWLKETMQKKGWKVWSPDLPDAGYPDIDKWSGAVFANREWKFDKDSVIVGHSSGATLILGLLEKLPKNVIIKKAILVAGYVEWGTLTQYYKYREKMLKRPFNWEKIKNSCSEFVFINSNNDPYECGKEQGEVLQGHLGGKLVIMQGEGHFNLERGPQYKQFPQILKYLE